METIIAAFAGLTATHGILFLGWIISAVVSYLFYKQIQATQIEKDLQIAAVKTEKAAEKEALLAEVKDLKDKIEALYEARLTDGKQHSSELKEMMDEVIDLVKMLERKL